MRLRNHRGLRQQSYQCTAACTLFIFLCIFFGVAMGHVLLANTLGMGLATAEAASSDSKEQRREFGKLKKKFEQDRSKPTYERLANIQDLAKMQYEPAVQFLMKEIETARQSVVKQMIIRAMGGKNMTKSFASYLISKGFAKLEIQSYGVIAGAFAGVDNSDTIDWLVTKGWKAIPTLKPRAQKIIIEAVGNTGDPRAAKAALKLLGVKKIRMEGQVALIKILRQMKYEKAAKKIGKMFRWGRKEIMIEVLFALNDLGATDQSKIFFNALEAGVWEVRAAALDVMGRSRDPKMLRHILPLLQDRNIGVKLAAVQAIRLVGGEAAMDPLIAALGKAKGRLLDDLLDTLLWLTGHNAGDTHIAWEAWWSFNRGKVKIEGISIEEYDAVIAEQMKKTTGTYYGLRVVSNFLTFVVDVSGSMAESYVMTEEELNRGKPKDKDKGGGTTGVGESDEEKEKRKKKAKKVNRKKIEVAKIELARALHVMKDGTQFNILKFDTFCNSWQPEIIAKDPEVLEKALKYVEGLNPGGETNVYDTLIAALSDEKIDTLYFLSDGAPTAGRITDHKEIVEKVTEFNRLRKVKIHTIGFKLDPLAEKLMRKLAQENYGTFIKM